MAATAQKLTLLEWVVEGTSPAIETRIATPDDREIVVQTYLKLLSGLADYNYDVLPTQKNADHFTDKIFMPAASRGDPILIGWDGERPAGMIFWVVQNLPYEARWSHAFDYGIHVDPEYRRQKVGTKIWNAGIEILKAKGVERLLSGVSLRNEASLKGGQQLGLIPDQLLTYRVIEPHLTGGTR